MANPLRDPGRSDDATVMVRYDDWYLKGEDMRRVALHVHGDEAARKRLDEILENLNRLDQVDPPLTLEELNDAVSGIAVALDLSGYAAELRCAPDPLKTAIDISFFSGQDRAMTSE